MEVLSYSIETGQHIAYNTEINETCDAYNDAFTYLVFQETLLTNIEDSYYLFCISGIKICIDCSVCSACLVTESLFLGWVEYVPNQLFELFYHCNVMNRALLRSVIFQIQRFMS